MLKAISADPITILLKQELSDFRALAHKLQGADRHNILAANVDAYERVLNMLHLQRNALWHITAELERAP